MDANDDPFFQEFVVNLRWLCYYATHCLNRSTEARYPTLLDDAATLFDALPSSAAAVHSLASLPLGALQVATEGAVYLLVAEQLLGGCPPTMHAFLDHMEHARRHDRVESDRTTASSSSPRSSRMHATRDGGSVDVCMIGSLSTDELNQSLPSGRSDTCAESQAMLLLVRWLVAEKIVSVQKLAETLQITDSVDSPHRRMYARMATQLAQVSPFYLGAHVLLTRSLLLWHCGAITTGDDVQGHARCVAGETWEVLRDQAPWHGSQEALTIEQDILLWIDCVLKRVEEEVQTTQLTSGTPATSATASPVRSRRRAPRTNPASAPSMVHTMDYLRIRRHRGTRRYPPTTSLVANLRDGMDVCLLLHFYEPTLLPLASIQVVERADHSSSSSSSRSTAMSTRDDVARATWNWSCALRVLGIVGLWPGLAAEEVVSIGESVLPLHVLRILEEMFVLLATRAEESLRDSVAIEYETSLFTTGEPMPTSLTASTIPVEPYRASSPSGPTALPPFSHSGLERGPTAVEGSSEPHVVTHSVSQPFARSATREDDDALIAQASRDSPPPLPKPRLFSSNSTVPTDWEGSEGGAGAGGGGDFQVRHPIRPLVKRRSKTRTEMASSTATSARSDPATAAGHASSRQHTTTTTVNRSHAQSDTALSWLDVTDPVFVSSRDAAAVITARTAADSANQVRGTRDLVQSSNSSISSVYAVSDDVTEDTGLPSATASAVARSRFTITRTFSKPSEEPPAVVLQSTSTNSARSLFEAAQAPLADGSPPFGVYSTPKRAAHRPDDAATTDVDTDDVVATWTDDKESSSTAVVVTADPGFTTPKESTTPISSHASDDDGAHEDDDEDELETFEIQTPATTTTTKTTADTLPPLPKQHEHAITLPSVAVTITTAVPPSAAPVTAVPVFADSAATLLSEPVVIPDTGVLQSVTSSQFFESPSPLGLRGSKQSTERPQSGLEAEDSGVLLAQFSSISTQRRPDDEVDCDEPSVSIDIDAPPDSDRTADATTADDGEETRDENEEAPWERVNESPEPPLTSEQDHERDGEAHVPSSVHTASASVHSRSVHSPASSDSECQTSEFVVRKVELPPEMAPANDDSSKPDMATAASRTPAKATHVDSSMEVASPSPIAASANNNLARSFGAPQEADVMSAQTPESLSAADGLPQDTSVDESTVYGSYAPSGVNDSWFSSVSRPGGRRTGGTADGSASIPRDADHAALLATVQEQQRLIQHLTSLLQQRSGAASVSASNNSSRRQQSHRDASVSERHDRAASLSSLGAQTVERAGQAASVATGVSGQLAASDVTTCLQGAFDDSADTNSSWPSPTASSPPS